MKYRSTRDSSLIKPFSEVLLGGLAPDGGLYMPHDLKTFNLEEIKSLVLSVIMNLLQKFYMNSLKMN